MIDGRTGRALLVAAIILAVSACTGIDVADTDQRLGLGCVDDSKHCVDQRAAALKSLMGDPARTWVKEPASPAAYASGVRLFAFKQRKRELSCDELGIGLKEADAAPGTLRGPAAKSLTPAQISRGVMFAAEVAKELGAERKRRCKA